MATSEKQTADTVAPTEGAPKRRPRLSQDDVPSYSLEQALRVPRAIADNYAFNPTRPLNVAHAMGMSPTSGPFRSITGAATAYGLTTGAARAPEIGLTPLGMRIVRPTAEGDDLAAQRDAFLRPKIIGEFLRSYDGAALPAEQIARNVLQQQGVPAERVDEVLQLIIDGGTAVGFVREVKGRRYVDLAGSITPTADDAATPQLSAHTSMPASPGAAAPVAVSVGSGIHVNIEIHIAADASSETIEDIFRNMRRYVLSESGHADGVEESK